MNPPRPRRLAFELLEPKASPSALLLALAPLDEPDQRTIETARAMYAPTSTTVSTKEANTDLLRFIERHTQSPARPASAIPLPTPAQAAAADNMMQATDTDLRTMLITEMLDAASAECQNVCSIIQY